MSTNFKDAESGVNWLTPNSVNITMTDSDDDYIYDAAQSAIDGAASRVDTSTIIGIVVAVVLSACIIFGIIASLYISKRKQRKQQELEAQTKEIDALNLPNTPPTAFPTPAPAYTAAASSAEIPPALDKETLAGEQPAIAEVADNQIGPQEMDNTEIHPMRPPRVASRIVSKYQLDAGHLV